MEKKVLVSVLMTSYNREAFVANAIESVLASSYTDFEFIICDDCSTDNTYEIEKQYAAKDTRIRLYRNDCNLGDFPNRDKVASYATGTYIKYVDSDDFIFPDGLKKMVESIQAFPGAVLGLSQIASELNNEKQYPIQISPERAYAEHFYGYGTLRYGPTGAIIRRDVLIEMGGFGQNRYVGDTELWLKIVARYPLIKIEPDVVEWRRHEGQEYYHGMKYDIYIQKTYPVYMASLNASTCPLKKTDIDLIKRRLRWKHARDILSVAGKGKCRLAFQIYREADFGLLQLLQGIKPYKKVKKLFHREL
ncbi:MAG: glycosyltransferase family 2 protein [Chitinophagaceae bacterium]|nr:glycosyltransferase family 2 protein [Chitinophagaceae bacterium]